MIKLEKQSIIVSSGYMMREKISGKKLVAVLIYRIIAHTVRHWKQMTQWTKYIRVNKRFGI